MKRNQSVDWTEIGDVVIGCAMPEAEQGMNVARIASLFADLPHSVPAMTINRFVLLGCKVSLLPHPSLEMEIIIHIGWSSQFLMEKTFPFFFFLLVQFYISQHIHRVGHNINNSMRFIGSIRSTTSLSFFFAQSTHHRLSPQLSAITS